ncbi:hypothetical protein ACOJBO_13265 [Rhizobium beringeri]
MELADGSPFPGQGKVEQMHRSFIKIDRGYYRDPAADALWTEG